jgi:hypothetical protein
VALPEPVAPPRAPPPAPEGLVDPCPPVAGSVVIVVIVVIVSVGVVLVRVVGPAVWPGVPVSETYSVVPPAPVRLAVVAVDPPAVAVPLSAAASWSSAAVRLACA